jgi:hypothetical protein
MKAQDMPPHSPIVFVVPWWSTHEQSADFHARFIKQLRTEVGPGHVMYNVPARVIARHGPDDDTLFELLDGSGRMAVVHLTWAKGQERLSWPGTSIYASLQAFADECMMPEHKEWIADDVSLDSFARDGYLGPLEIGVSRQEISDKLGPPPMWSGASLETGDIWKYGDLELHFADDVIWLIHFDWFDIPTTGGALDLDPWVIRHGMSLAELGDACRKGNIAFSVEPDVRNPDCVKLVTSGGVEFVVDTEGDEPGLKIFGKSGRRDASTA